MSDDKPLFRELYAALEDSPFVMLGLQSRPGHDEPMTAQFDSHTYPKTLYFFTRTDNRLALGLSQNGPDAVAAYASKGHELFAALHGRLTPCRDGSLVDRFWSDGVAAWYEGGKHDPALLLLQFEVSHVEVWRADMTAKGKLKRLVGSDVSRDDFDGAHASVAL